MKNSNSYWCEILNVYSHMVCSRLEFQNYFFPSACKCQYCEKYKHVANSLTHSNSLWNDLNVNLAEIQEIVLLFRILISKKQLCAFHLDKL